MAEHWLTLNGTDGPGMDIRIGSIDAVGIETAQAKATGPKSERSGTACVITLRCGKQIMAPVAAYPELRRIVFAAEQEPETEALYQQMKRQPLLLR